MICFLEILECTCNAEGSVTQQCDANTGACTCNTNIIGNNCDEPEVGFFGFPTPKGFYHILTNWFYNDLKLLYYFHYLKSFFPRMFV